MDSQTHTLCGRLREFENLEDWGSSRSRISRIAQACAPLDMRRPAHVQPLQVLGKGTASAASASSSMMRCS